MNQFMELLNTMGFNVNCQDDIDKLHDELFWSYYVKAMTKFGA